MYVEVGGRKYLKARENEVRVCIIRCWCPGHAVFVRGFDRETLVVVTWG